MTKEEFIKQIFKNKFSCTNISCKYCEKYTGRSCASVKWDERKHLKSFYDKEMIEKNLERW